MPSCSLPRWFCLVFFLILRFARAANNNAKIIQERRDLIVGSTEMLTVEEIFTTVFKPLPRGVHFSNYEASIQGSALAVIPQELWGAVIMSAHPEAIWMWGLTCKWAAAFFRDQKLGIYKGFCQKNWLSMLIAIGTISIHSRMTEQLIFALQNIYPPDRQRSVETLYLAWYAICIRSKDLRLPQIPVKLFGLDGQHRSFLIPLKDHLYATLNQTSHTFYLPPPNAGVKLLQRIDPRLVSSSVSVTTATKNFKFFIPLLLDYIIPMYRGEPNISLNEYAMANFLFSQHSDGLKDYMKLLLWALFFTAGTFRKNDKHVVGPISRFFDSLRIFNWSEICGGRPKIRDYQDNKMSLDEGYIKRIFIVAEQWHLDWRMIAQNTHWSPLSKQILSGNIPDFLANPPNYSCLEMYKIIYNADPVKMKVVGNKVEVDEEALQAVTTKAVENRVELGQAPAPALPNKRSADGELVASAPKKQKFDEYPPGAQPNAIIESGQTIQLSDQQLMNQIMNQIGHLRQLIEATHNAQQTVVYDPQRDYSVHLQTLDILQSTVQSLNLPPQPVFQAPHQIMPVQPSNVYLGQQHGAFHPYNHEHPVNHVHLHQAMPPQYMVHQQPFFRPQPQQLANQLIMQSSVVPLPNTQPQQQVTIDIDMLDSKKSESNY